MRASAPLATLDAPRLMLAAHVRLLGRRIYAQALTIGALLAAAGVELYGQQTAPRALEDHANEYQPHGKHSAARQ
jgi:hypothetical protein